MTTQLIWSGVFEDAVAPFVSHHETMLYNVIEPAGDTAAAIALQWWLEDECDEPYSSETNWQLEIGDDETTTRAHVMIHEPSHLAGLYLVECERKVVARGYADDPADAPDVAALLSAEPAEAAA